MISDRLFHRLVLQFMLVALKHWGFQPDIRASEGSNLAYRIEGILGE